MEKWKGFKKSKYEVSTFGRIRNSKTGRVLKTFSGKDYPETIKLVIKGKKKNYYVHRLVAEAFIDNPENKKEVDHIDRNNKNNNIENLRWATREENCINRLLISKKILKDIFDFYKTGLSVDEVYNKVKNLN